ncbi:hypothetical protein [Methanosarcina mazei]|nr:hypothetical protein [Methanosarcina mazei]
MIIGKLRKKDLIINMVNKIIHQPGDSNRGQLPLQGSALPLSYLGRQIWQ